MNEFDSTLENFRDHADAIAILLHEAQRLDPGSIAHIQALRMVRERLGYAANCIWAMERSVPGAR